MQEEEENDILEEGNINQTRKILGPDA